MTVTTTGTDGSAVSPNFQFWSGAAPVSATQLAANIRTAIGPAAAVGVGATGSGAVVTITATATGLAGNSINVATTISSGLAAPAFNGNLTGGAAGITGGTTFSTSTDSGTASVNLAAEAAALASAINTNVPAVDATAAGAVVTVTAANGGVAGNSITLTETFASGFIWAAGTLTGGVDGRPSIIAYNQLYSDQGTVGGFCNQNGPSVMWSYNIGTGTVVTSSVLSLDGTKHHVCGKQGRWRSPSRSAMAGRRRIARRSGNADRLVFRVERVSGQRVLRCADRAHRRAAGDQFVAVLRLQPRRALRRRQRGPAA